MLNILVIGAGAVGLSSALCIQESCGGDDVTVTLMAEKFSPDTTSDGSAGFWQVFELGDTDPQLVGQLSTDTYEYMRDLARSPLASITGTQSVLCYQLYEEKLKTEPAFKDVVDGYRRLTAKEIARMYSEAKDGFIFETQTMDVTRYLKWLTDRFLSNGGRIVQRKVNSLKELSSEWDVVVSCVGIGARELIHDRSVFPIRGQVYRVRAPWLKHCFLYFAADGSTFYALLNTDNVVVGGTFQKGDWNTDINRKDSRDIWNRAVKVCPSIENAEILREWAGLRPCRDSLRLETEVMEIGQERRKVSVVHNYGHGGAGLTIHWGCAKKTAGMVSQILQDLKSSNDRTHTNTSRSNTYLSKL